MNEKDNLLTEILGFTKTLESNILPDDYAVLLVNGNKYNGIYLGLSDQDLELIKRVQDGIESLNLDENDRTIRYSFKVQGFKVRKDFDSEKDEFIQTPIDIYVNVNREHMLFVFDTVYEYEYMRFSNRNGDKFSDGLNKHWLSLSELYGILTN